MISNDTFIELLTAGLNRHTMPDAEVEWDVVLDGRQFDVLVTQKFGMHKAIIAFEVKDKKRAVSVDQIDAFITKAKDIGANKTVFVSTSGFQSGAKKTAKRHHMDLFNLSFVEGESPKLPPSYRSIAKDLRALDEPLVIDEGPTEMVHVVEKVVLKYADGTEAELPQEQSQMTYYAERIVDAKGASLLSHITPKLPHDIQLKAVRSQYILLDEVFSAPDTYFVKNGRVCQIDVRFTDMQVKTLRGNARIEPSSFSKPVRYENVMSGECLESEITDLPIGPRTPKVGGYYFQYFPLRYFYCAGVSKGLMDMHMVESFQNSQLIQCSFTQDTRYIVHYIPLNDRKIENRLHDRFQRMQIDR